MARYALLPLVTLMLAAGCQQQSVLVSGLPSPSFEPPHINESPTPPVKPPVVAPPVKPPVVPQPPAVVLPKDWAPPVASRAWQWIVVHHSATPTGGAVAFDRLHRNNGWDELGYHFVIGNGTDTANGLVEVGGRWIRQKWGAHTKTADNRYNNFGIGVCLVGNFDIERPTAQQLQSLSNLLGYLMKTYKIPPERIVGHRDCKATDCPGRNISIADVRRGALAAMGRLAAGPDVRSTSLGRTTAR